MATRDKTIPVESVSLGSDEVYSLICLPCHREGITIPAYSYCIDCLEHLCQGCFRHHRRATRLKHHKIQDKETMPSTQQLSDAPVHTATTGNLTTPCPHHKTEMIKFYCHSHNKLLCCICVALEHTKPCNVDYIADISDDTLNSLDYKHTMNRLNKLWNKCTTLKKETAITANKSDESLKVALQEIKKYRQVINERINELQEDVEAKIKAIHHENNEKTLTVETICVDIMKTVKSMYDSIKQTEVSKEANQLFIEIKEAQKLLRDYERTMRSLSADETTAEYKFIPSEAINEILENEKMIGQISAEHPERAGPGASSMGNVPLPSADVTITPTCLGEICVKTSEDVATCLISGMTMLPPDKLVLTDWENKTVKLNSQSITSQLELGTEDDDRPWGITTTSSTQVAVTVPYRYHIQFISVTDKLSKTHILQTDGYCMGIFCHQDKLVVTYWNPSKLEILDMSGNIIKEVAKDSAGKDVFIKPACVKANSESIYVSDIVSKTVIMLNWKGEITGFISHLNSPRGLVLLGAGSLLVCDKESGVVYQTSGVCTNRRMVLQDVSHPYALCVGDGGHKLYISRYTKNEYDNAILVYNI